MPKAKAVNKVVFLGKKPGAAAAIGFLLNQGVKVAAIVVRKQNGKEIYALAKKHGLLIFEDDKALYEMINKKDKRLADVDLVISYLFWKKIRTPLIKLGTKGCVNFHPAPLPDYKGLAGYNTAILDQRADYGVSAHFIKSEDFDSGPIIKVLKFPIDSKQETVISLERKSQAQLLLLFQKVITDFIKGAKLKTKKNQGGVYINKEQFEKLKAVNLNKDSLETIDRKIRAFFFPPYAGAYITIKGEKYTLLNQAALNAIYEEKNTSHNR